MIYDAIVVGAGPAGAVLAHQLATRGLRVLILERTRLPRYKPCGGGVTLKTVRSLPFDASSVFEVQAEAGRLTYRGRTVAKAVLDRPAAWLVMRDRFDQFLAERAQEAGARLIESATVNGFEQHSGGVTVRCRQGQTFSGRLLAGADGVYSVVARAVDLLPGRNVGVALEAEVAVPDAARAAQGAEATFDFGALPHGYGWIFPKRDHLSIGVFAAQPGKAPHIKAYLRQFAASQATLREATWLTVRGHLIPLGGALETLHRDRVLLVGDAANLADPWLGEGLYYAVSSARIAADVIAGALDAGRVDLSAYTSRVHAEIVRDFRYAQRLSRVVMGFPRLCSAFLSRSSLLQEGIFGVVRGDETFGALYHRLKRQIPKVLLQAVVGRSGAAGWDRGRAAA
ncbi:MAG: geranylgeranyl reductase family protein [Anaerolineales bacterium]|nr:geranylgeranyl reductase family protein [Anaerolineales bacterium]